MDLKIIESFLDKNYPSNMGFFVFGSHLYGTAGSQSDIDLVVIDDTQDGKTTSGKYDIQFISLDRFISQVKKCDIKSLECYFTKEKFLKIPLNIKFDPTQLRSSISKKSSHAWVKGKKKIIDGEFYIGKKSFFHSLRILDFGIQLATHGEIYDYQSTRHEYFQIINTPPHLVEEKFKSKYNEYHSEFKKVCPKNSI